MQISLYRGTAFYSSLGNPVTALIFFFFWGGGGVVGGCRWGCCGQGIFFLVVGTFFCQLCVSEEDKIDIKECIFLSVNQHPWVDNTSNEYWDGRGKRFTGEIVTSKVFFPPPPPVFYKTLSSPG